MNPTQTTSPGMTPVQMTPATMTPIGQSGNAGNLWLQSFQAGLQQPITSLEQSQAALQQSQQAAAQVAFLAKAKNTLDAYKDPNTGFADPSVYNQIKNQGAALGIDSTDFDNNFEKGYTDPNNINYNTDAGYANRAQLGQITRQIEGNLQLYKAIPGDQKGLLGNSNIINQSYESAFANGGIGAMGKLAYANMIGTKNYVAQNAPDAQMYDSLRNSTSAQLRSLAGAAQGAGVRVTQTELDKWSSLLPASSDTPQQANDKINELDLSIKKTFNTPVGLDSRYLPSTQFGQTPPQSNNASGNTFSGFMSNIGHDAASLINSTLGLPQQLAKQNVVQNGLFGLLGLNPALNPTTGVQNVSGEAQNLNQDIGQPNQGGGLPAILGRAGQNLYNRPLSTGLDALTLLGIAKGAPEAGAVTSEGAAAPETVPVTKPPTTPTSGNPIPGDIIKNLATLGKQGGKAGAARDIQAAAQAGGSIDWEDIASQAKNAVANKSPQVQKAMDRLLIEQEPTPPTIGGTGANAAQSISPANLSAALLQSVFKSPDYAINPIDRAFSTSPAQDTQIGKQTLSSSQMLDMRQNLASRLHKNFLGQLQIPATDEEQNAANILRQIVTKNLKQAAPGIINPDKLYSFYSKIHGDAPAWGRRAAASVVADQILQKLPKPLSTTLRPLGDAAPELFGALFGG